LTENKLAKVLNFQAKCKFFFLKVVAKEKRIDKTINSGVK
jgi:hypothetical protein